MGPEQGLRLKFERLLVSVHMSMRSIVHHSHDQLIRPVPQHSVHVTATLKILSFNCPPHTSLPLRNSEVLVLRLFQTVRSSLLTSRIPDYNRMPRFKRKLAGIPKGLLVEGYGHQLLRSPKLRTDSPIDRKGCAYPSTNRIS